MILLYINTIVNDSIISEMIVWWSPKPLVKPQKDQELG